MTDNETSAVTEILFNPFDPAFRANPYPFYDRLRTEAPVYPTPFGNVVLSRYEDVAHTLRSADFSRDVVANAADPDTDFARRRRDRARGRTKNILSLDPPDHTRLRRIVTKAFTPTTIEALRPKMQAMVDEILDRAAERGSMELVDELAFPVPFQVISTMLDMPTDRADELREWSQLLTASLEPTADEGTLDRADEAGMLFGAYTAEVIADRRKHPGDDLLTALIQAEEAGDRMTEPELMSFVGLLYVAGHETTVNLIGNGTLALLRNPDQLKLWRETPELDANAVDELLRFDGPVQMTVRVPMVPVTYRVDDEDVVVAPRTIVTTVLGAANHDPNVFDEPHSLRLDRPNANRHLALAAGIHYCLGASLAKLEAQVAIGSLIRRFDTIELAEEPTWRDRLTIRGVDHMPITVS